MWKPVEKLLKIQGDKLFQKMIKKKLIPHFTRLIIYCYYIKNMFKCYRFRSMGNELINKVADCILLDPFLFNDFQAIRYGIPFYKNKEEMLILVKHEGLYKIGNYRVKTFKIEEEDFNEKVFLINNYDELCKETDGVCRFSSTTPTRVVLDFILIQSLLNNVSDVHFDIVDSSQYIVKFKIDTVLKKSFVLTKDQGDSVIMRMKVLSSIDTSKKHIPHSSSFYRNFRNNDVDFRFSTHPTFLGERCVLRVLQTKNVLSIEEIGLSGDVFDIAKKVINDPFGFVVFTGPTNSGKTTTIHSILKEIAKTGINIMTLEDPVEYRIPGIVQTNITESLDFFDGMRSILRQDPNVIFLGEIRDAKTALIAVQAAMTGHKVLTTLHAYSIKGAISRLLDMGVSHKMLAESILAIFSQRLVRKTVEKNGKKTYKGLALVSDACYFDEKNRDTLRSGEILDIENNLGKIAKKMIKDGITTEEEVRRVIG